MPKPVRPYLLTKGEDGNVRVTLRTTRFNSQGYPLVTSEPLPGEFATAFKARSHLRSEYQAKAEDICTS